MPPPISLALGEPQHAPPDFLQRELAKPERFIAQLGKYPSTRGGEELRRDLAAWLEGRYRLASGSLDPETQLLPVNGTREGLFAIAQTLISADAGGLVMLPNPFYQIYEGAALLAGATPRYLPCTRDTEFKPELGAVAADEWSKCRLMYLCNPGNPGGAVLEKDELIHLLALADEFDFVLVADECYSEIYPDEDRPPTGLLEACLATGRTDFRNCVVFNSLSKRSSLPGLRSGLVAGDARIIRDFLLYRTYHGSAMSPATQTLSSLAWRDEEHVIANRARYRDKLRRALRLLQGRLEIRPPDGGFYLWARTPNDDQKFAAALFAEQRVAVLPGSFLARETNGRNPGEDHVRIALVAEEGACETALTRLVEHLRHYA